MPYEPDTNVDTNAYGRTYLHSNGYRDAYRGSDGYPDRDTYGDPYADIDTPSIWRVHRSRGSGTLDELRGVERPQGGG